MLIREHRRYANTPEEKERLARRACPVCNRERSAFTPGQDTICCGSACSAKYWSGERSTVGEMRRARPAGAGGEMCPVPEGEPKIPSC